MVSKLSEAKKDTAMKYWNTILITSLVIVGFVFTTENVHGATYYVAKNGNDSNPGTEAQPWVTIQKAANTMVAGDTVYVKEGTYNEQVIPQSSGSSGNYITYSAYPGDTVTIDGNNITLPTYETGMFVVEETNYITVSGLKIINAGPNDNNAGIYVDNANYVTIERNYTYNTVSSGIGVWGSTNIIIDGNEVQLACNDGEQECITVAGTNIFEVKNNHIHHGGPGTNGGEGICVKDGSSNGKVYNNNVDNITRGERTGIYVDAWNKETFNIEVYQNSVHDCAAGISLASEDGGKLREVKVYNNIVYNNQSNGLEIGNWGNPGVSPRPIEDITFINNTVYSNGNNEWGGGMYNGNPDVKNLVIRNNIFCQNTLFQIADEGNLSATNLTIDHNLIHEYTGEYEYEVRGDDYVEGDPKFVNVSGADFHLQESSPAIGKGASTDAPNEDYEGNQRPQGAGYDIGAYEYIESDGIDSTDCMVDITGLEIKLTATATVGDPVTFTASAISSCSGVINYRFDVIPDYGTDDYDPNNVFQSLQDFSTANICTHTFNESGGYIIVVWASPTLSIPTDIAPPIIGGSITIE
jgi:hypothetical protein